MHGRARIALVGDIHDCWDPLAERAALRSLQADLVLFVGDLGNEAVGIARAIAALDWPKAIVLGNHDAWYTATHWGRQKCPYNREREDRVRQQLDLLGDAHIGYGKRDFPQLQLSVVGGRPFSWGGPRWTTEAFYHERYGVDSLAASRERIAAAAWETAYDTVIFLGHNGPAGLGNRAEAICGRDWEPRGGDYGDPDLAGAIAQARAAGKTVPFVAFGHMHHTLRHTQAQRRTAVAADAQGTLGINCARVPRIIERDGQRWRNLTLVTLAPDASVGDVSLLWLDSAGRVGEREALYGHPHCASGAISG